ncbi:hypothetical protein INR49_005039, partial [Caranx melampygus]
METQNELHFYIPKMSDDPSQQVYSASPPLLLLAEERRMSMCLWIVASATKKLPNTVLSHSFPLLHLEKRDTTTLKHTSAQPFRQQSYKYQMSFLRFLGKEKYGFKIHSDEGDGEPPMNLISSMTQGVGSRSSVIRRSPADLPSPSLQCAVYRQTNCRHLVRLQEPQHLSSTTACRCDASLNSLVERCEGGRTDRNRPDVRQEQVYIRLRDDLIHSN